MSSATQLFVHYKSLTMIYLFMKLSPNLGWRVASSWGVLEALLRAHLLNIQLFIQFAKLENIVFSTVEMQTSSCNHRDPLPELQPLALVAFLVWPSWSLAADQAGSSASAAVDQLGVLQPLVHEGMQGMQGMQGIQGM